MDSDVVLKLNLEISCILALILREMGGNQVRFSTGGGGEEWETFEIGGTEWIDEAF